MRRELEPRPHGTPRAGHAPVPAPPLPPSSASGPAGGGARRGCACAQPGGSSAGLGGVRGRERPAVTATCPRSGEAGLAPQRSRGGVCSRLRRTRIPAGEGIRSSQLSRTALLLFREPSSQDQRDCVPHGVQAPGLFELGAHQRLAVPLILFLDSEQRAHTRSTREGVVEDAVLAWAPR